jgi:hypothetical protein
MALGLASIFHDLGWALEALAGGLRCSLAQAGAARHRRRYRFPPIRRAATGRPSAIDQRGRSPMITTLPPSHHTARNPREVLPAVLPGQRLPCYERQEGRDVYSLMQHQTMQARHHSGMHLLANRAIQISHTGIFWDSLGRCDHAYLPVTSCCRSSPRVGGDPCGLEAQP